MQATSTISRRSRAAATALSSVLAAVLSWTDLALADAVVRQVSGQVEVGRGEPPTWAPLALGATVLPEDRVRTGPDGRVELALESATLRVHENSLLALPPAAVDADRVELERGLSLFDVVRREGRRFEVQTPTVVVSVKGTRFGVEASAKAGIVSVYRGVVGVRAAEATEVVETLVREGFLATGGGDDRPIELDVVPHGDPWSAWQELHTGGPSRSSAEAPDSDLDRARTSLRRATDEEVLKRAAERRPEIAERLRQHTADAKNTPNPEQDAKEAPIEPTPLPASPAAPDSFDVFDSVEGLDRTDEVGLPSDEPVEPVDSQREILDMKRVGDSLQAVDSVVDVPTLTGGTPLTNGGTTLSTDHLESHDPREVMMLMDALQDMQAASDSLARPWTENDMAVYLEGQLVDQGMSIRDAKEMVDPLFE